MVDKQAGREPIRDIAHLGRVELLTPKPDKSLCYFRDVLGMEVARAQGQSVYLRAASILSENGIFKNVPVFDPH